MLVGSGSMVQERDPSTACPSTESWQVAVVDSSIAEQLLAMVDQEMQKQALDIVVQLLKNGNHLCWFLFLFFSGQRRGARSTPISVSLQTHACRSCLMLDTSCQRQWSG